MEIFISCVGGGIPESSPHKGKPGCYVNNSCTLDNTEISSVSLKMKESTPNNTPVILPNVVWQ